MIKKLSKDVDYKNLISKGKWLVDFSATWCGPCKMLEPVLDEVEKEVNILKVDIDEFQDLTIQMGIMSVPTLVLYNDGKELKKVIGYHTLEELNEIISESYK